MFYLQHVHTGYHSLGQSHFVYFPKKLKFVRLQNSNILCFVVFLGCPLTEFSECNIFSLCAISPNCYCVSLVGRNVLCQKEKWNNRKHLKLNKWPSTWPGWSCCYWLIIAINSGGQTQTVTIVQGTTSSFKWSPPHLAKSDNRSSCLHCFVSLCVSEEVTRIHQFSWNDFRIDGLLLWWLLAE